MRGLCRLAIQQLDRAAFIAIGLVVSIAPFVGTSSPRASAQPRETRPPTTRRAALESFGSLPMGFEANVGQADGRAQYVARGAGYAVSVSGAGAAVALGAASRADVLRVALAGADALARPVAEQPLPGRTNYLVGNDETTWRRGVESYAAVRYLGVYRGIDAVYYGTQSQLEYDLVVAPGADSGQIRLRFEGQRRLSVDRAGELVLELPNGEVRQQRARVYQDLPEGRRFVASRYAIDPDRSVRIVLGEYDRARPLVVDPVVAYADYIGGSFGEVGTGIGVDVSGAAYVGGQTNSPNFPTTPGAYDTVYQGAQGRNEAFVAKISPDGSSLVYSTFLGTTDSTQALGLAVDGAGSAYLAGTTGTNYPTTPGAFDRTSGQCFVTKLSADGASLAYSTFLNAIWIRAIAVDAAGSAYVTGSAAPTGFPTTPGAFDTTSNGLADAFVTKFAADGGSLVYSTLLGGSGEDEGYAIALDSSGNAYVAGTALSSNFPVSEGAYDTTYNGTDSGNVPYGDAFVTKVSATGAALGFSTYLGGSDEDVAFGIAVDSQGRAVVAGRTESAGFPTTAGAFDTTYDPGDGQPGNGPGDAFVTKLEADGVALAFSTFLGSSRSDTARDVTLDPDGTVYVVGETYGANFPVTPGAPPIPERTSGGIESRDAFITSLAADGESLVYSTIFGEPGDDDTANAIAIDSQGAVYVTGFEGLNTTLPSGFGVPGGGAYVMKLRLNAADLEVSQQMTPDPVATGSNLTIEITVTNSGALVAENVALDTATPVGTTFVSASSSQGMVVASPPAGGTGAVEVALGSLAVGESATVTLVVNANCSLANGATIGSMASVETSTNEVSLSDNQSSASAAVSDPAPVVTCPPNVQTGAAAGLCSAVVSFSPSATDNCAGATVACSPPSGSAFPVGTTTVSCVATGANGNMSNPCTFTVTVVDSQAPAISCPADVTALATSPGGAIVEFAAPSASDACPGVTVACSPPSGSQFAVGTTTVTCVAEDASGNTSNCQFTVDVVPVGTDTVGVYLPTSSSFFLRNSNSPGAADLVFGYGPAGLGWLAIRGDWNGDGVDTPGLYDPSTGFFFLKNTQGPGGADLVFSFGPGGAGFLPLVGDWNGDGVDTIGIYASDSGAFFLRNQNAPGGADLLFTFGAGKQGFVPLAGDWDGDGDDTVGLYFPSNGFFFLRNANGPGGADLTFSFGPGGAGIDPVVGDYDGDGDDTVGVYLQSSGTWFLRQTNTPGPADLAFGYGPPNAKAFVGDWDGQ